MNLLPSSNSITDTSADSNSIDGVIAARCYGCNRCVISYPLGLIITESYTITPKTINELFLTNMVDAIEIHTLEGHEDSFQNLWNNIGDVILTRAKVLAISFPNMADKTLPYLLKLQKIISSHESF